MSGESILQFEPSSIQTILIALVVICAIAYGFIEFRKINTRLQGLESTLSRLGEIESRMIHEMDNNVIDSGYSIHSDEVDNKEDVEDIEGTDTDTSKATFNKIEQYEETEYDVELMSDIDRPKFDSKTTYSDAVGEAVGDTVGDAVGDTVGEAVGEAVGDTVGDTNIDPILMNKIINQVESTKSDSHIIPNSINTVEEVIQREVITTEEPKSHDTGFFISVTKNTVDTIDTTKNTVDTTNTADTTDTTNTNYDECTIKELKDILIDLNLPTSGNKVKLIQRILSNKK